MSDNINQIWLTARPIKMERLVVLYFAFRYGRCRLNKENKQGNQTFQALRVRFVSCCLTSGVVSTKDYGVNAKQTNNFFRSSDIFSDIRKHTYTKRT